MDPKQLNQLDPKLKAAYDRVMSTTVSTTAVNAPAVHPSVPTPPATATPSTTPSAPTVHTVAPTAPAVRPHATNFIAPQTHTSAITSAAVPKAEEPKKAKGKVSPVIIVLGGIVFLAVYILLWITVFKIPLPF